MRVLVLSMTFPNPKQPALGVFIRERIRRVARDCDVLVVAPVPWFPLNRWIRGRQWHDIPAYEETQGLRIFHPRFLSIPRYGKWLDALLYACSLLPFLVKTRRSFPFDVIDAHFVYPDGVAAVLLGKLFRVPVVITLRGSIVRLATYPLHRPLIRWALQHAARIVAVSRSLKQVATGLGVASERIRVIPNGVDAARFHPMNRAEARRTLNLPADGTMLLSIGGLNEGKGFHRLVAAMPHVLRRRPDTLLAIVGGARPGDSVQPLVERLVREHGLERHVLLAGERPHDEIPTWLAACDVFCLATRSEGWSNVSLEALACGRPVVTTRVGGNPEIVVDDRLGLLVDPSDDAALVEAILGALDRTWDADTLAAYARQYSWEAAASEVVQELSGALGAYPVDHRAALAGVKDRGLR